MCSAVCAYISKIDSASFASVSVASSLRLETDHTKQKALKHPQHFVAQKKWDDHVYYSYCHSNHTHTYTHTPHSGQPGSSSERLPRHLCSPCEETWCVCVGRHLAKDKDHVSDTLVSSLPYLIHGWPPQQSVPLCRCECYDYLFDIAVWMKQCGLDPAQPQ